MIIDPFTLGVFAQTSLWFVTMVAYKIIVRKFYWLEPFRMSTYCFIAYYIIESNNLMHGIALFFLGEFAWSTGLNKNQPQHGVIDE